MHSIFHYQQSKQSLPIKFINISIQIFIVPSRIKILKPGQELISYSTYEQKDLKITTSNPVTMNYNFKIQSSEMAMSIPSDEAQDIIQMSNLSPEARERGRAYSYLAKNTRINFRYLIAAAVLISAVSVMLAALLIKYNRDMEDKDMRIEEMTALSTGYLANISQSKVELAKKQMEINKLLNISKQYLSDLSQAQQELKKKQKQLADLTGLSKEYLTSLAQIRSQVDKDSLSIENLAKFIHQPKSGNSEIQSFKTETSDVLGSKIEKLLKHQVKQFDQDKSTQKGNLLLTMRPQIAKFGEQFGIGQSGYQEKLAIHLAEAQDEEKAFGKLLEIEYQRANEKYKLSKPPREIPICVLVYNSLTVNQENINLLKSLQALNYTNFHIVYIEDAPISYESSPQSVEQFLQKSKMRVKNRIKIVRNEESYGALANLYFGAKNFCNQGDVVFLLDKGSSLLGKQSFKILNSVYQQPDVMYAKSGVLLRRSEYDLVSSQIKEPEEELTADRKYAKKFLIRSFRKALLDSVQVQNLLQFEQDTLAFFEAGLNSFPLYAQLSKIAKSKGIDLPEYLEIAHQVHQNCEQAHQEYLNWRTKLSGSAYSLQGAEKIQFTPSAQTGNKYWGKMMEVEENLAKCRTKYRQKIEFNLKNPVKVVYGDKVYKKTIYNQKAADKPFGRQKKYMVNLLDFLPKVNTDWRSFKSQLVKNQSDVFYILTPPDYDVLVRSNKIDFEKMKLQIEMSIPFEILQFEEDKKINMTPPLIQMEALKTPQQAQQFLTKKLRVLNKDLQFPDDIAYHLAAQIQTNPDSRQVIEGEYYYVDKRLNISQQQKQLPICIVSSEYNVYGRQNGYLFKKYFETLETLNYTNYHVVYIDDASTDGSAELIYDYVKKSNMKVKNRMKIVHILQNVGVTANIFYWPQKMCAPDEIVVLIDADDNILGRQSLKAFNHLYTDPNIWTAYTRHLWQPKSKLWVRRGGTFGEKNADARRITEWLLSNTRTFKTKLMMAVPFHAFIEYHFDAKDYIAWPVFQDLSGDSVEIYCHAELAGKDRIGYYDGLTYGYSGSSGTNNCYLQLEMYDWRKTNSRTRLQRLNSLDEKGKLRDDDQFPLRIYDDAKRRAKIILDSKCFKK